MSTKPKAAPAKKAAVAAKKAPVLKKTAPAEKKPRRGSTALEMLENMQDAIQKALR